MKKIIILSIVVIILIIAIGVLYFNYYKVNKIDSLTSAPLYPNSELQEYPSAINYSHYCVKDISTDNLTRKYCQLLQRNGWQLFNPQNCPDNNDIIIFTGLNFRKADKTIKITIPDFATTGLPSIKQEIKACYSLYKIYDYCQTDSDCKIIYEIDKDKSYPWCSCESVNTNDPRNELSTKIYIRKEGTASKKIFECTSDLNYNCGQSACENNICVIK